jgi:DNA repair exonuclease SbcCD ATPase subunit
MKKRLLPLLLSGLLLLFLSGCGENTDLLKAKISDQQREIAQLKEANESLEKESTRARVWQGDVNLAFVYEFAGPLRWLPVWDKLALQLKTGQEIMKAGMPPDWHAWVILGALYIAAAGVIGAGVGVMLWVRESERLKDKLRDLQEQLREGQQQLERLRRSEKEVAAAREELHETRRQIEDDERRRAQVREEVQALEQRKQNLSSEIEREKARALEEYWEQREREQRAVQEAAEKIAKALDDL